MKIVVEGPNNVGKSTFIDALKRTPALNHFEVEHVDGGCPNDYAFHKNMLMLPQDMIFDRFYIGETIYPYIYGREPKLTQLELESLIKDFNDTVIVFIDADYNFINRAYINKGEKDEIDQNFIFIEKSEFYFKRDLCEKLGAKVFYIKNRIEGKGYNSDIDSNTVINAIVDIYNNQNNEIKEIFNNGSTSDKS